MSKKALCIAFYFETSEDCFLLLPLLFRLLELLKAGERRNFYVKEERDKKCNSCPNLDKSYRFDNITSKRITTANRIFCSAGRGL